MEGNSISHLMHLDSEPPQRQLYLGQIAAKLVAAILGIQPPFFKRAVPFGGDGPQCQVQHFRGCVGKLFAAWILLHGVSRVPEYLPKTFQRPRFNAVLVGQWLNGDSCAEFRKELVGGGLITVANVLLQVKGAEKR